MKLGCETEHIPLHCTAGVEPSCDMSRLDDDYLAGILSRAAETHVISQPVYEILRNSSVQVLTQATGDRKEDEDDEEYLALSPACKHGFAQILPRGNVVYQLNRPRESFYEYREN